jgi:hypothetical protein
MTTETYLTITMATLLIVVLICVKNTITIEKLRRENYMLRVIASVQQLELKKFEKIDDNTTTENLQCDSLTRQVSEKEVS